MRFQEIKEASRMITLYHGTCSDSAKILLSQGWSSNSGTTGGNQGNPGYLYLTTEYDDAMWFAQQKGCNTVLKISDVPVSFLIVDPEDGVGDDVEDEINSKFGLPGKVVLTRSLPKGHFSLMQATNNG